MLPSMACVRIRLGNSLFCFYFIFSHSFVFYPHFAPKLCIMLLLRFNNLPFPSVLLQSETLSFNKRYMPSLFIRDQDTKQCVKWPKKMGCMQHCEYIDRKTKVAMFVHIIQYYSSTVI